MKGCNEIQPQCLQQKIYSSARFSKLGRTPKHSHSAAPTSTLLLALSLKWWERRSWKEMASAESAEAFCCGHVWETSRPTLHSNAAPYAVWMLAHPRDLHAAVLDSQTTHLSSWATSWLKGDDVIVSRYVLNETSLNNFPIPWLTGYVSFPIPL